MRLSSNLPIVIAMTGAAAASISGAIVAADRIELSASHDITFALQENELTWARVAVDGLQVTLSGRAPDEAARFNALSVAGGVVDATRVIDQMEVAPGQSIDPPDFSVEILRNVDGISLIGLIPAATDREAVLDRVRAIAGDTTVTDLLEVGDYPVPDSWEDALDYALTALGQLPRSKISVGESRVAITAIMDDAEGQRRIETELARAAPDGVTAALDINAPRPVIAPFTVRFLKDADGARFDACTADTVEARDMILAAANEAGMAARADCPIGLGAPTLEWGAAVAAGIAAVDRMGGGKITFSDTDVSLISLDTLPLPLFDREVGELERALPDVFSLYAVRPDPIRVDGTGVDTVDGAPEFIATRSPEGEVQLRGRITNDRARGIVESFAHARFGISNTYGATRLDAELPQGWELRVLAGLDALSYLSNGSVVVQPQFLSVRGDTGRPDASAEIARVLSERLGEGANFGIEVRYLEALDPIAGLPTPEECVASLNAILAEEKITFAPGSTTIEGDALATVDRLAEVLRDCQDVAMEIGGHTDSQGRESMNERLSQARANAVLEAIMARRVRTRNLSAQGYGESQPVADNDTEEGREANRRIEFKLVVSEEETDTAETIETPETPNEQN